MCGQIADLGTGVTPRTSVGFFGQIVYYNTFWKSIIGSGAKLNRGDLYNFEIV